MVRRPPLIGPFRADFWRSPLRGAWLTTLLGLALLGSLLVVITTGFLSHAAYNPDLGANAIVQRGRDFQPFIFDWPTRPTWLYALNQGLHVTVAIVTVPLLLAKMWAVIPKLWTWPPVKSPAHGLERLSLLALVGSAAFEFATGIANIQLWYPFHFGFVRAHYFGAWVFTSSLVLHVAVKVPAMLEAGRTRAQIVPAGEGTISRRGLFGLVAGASGALLVATAGQSIGGPLRRLALLAPRGGSHGDGPNDFPVNETAATTGIRAAEIGPAWRLQLLGDRPARLSRTQLLALSQTEADLPIACVEGWSTTQHWAGVPLRDLARLAGMPDAQTVHVRSLQRHGVFAQVTLSREQLHDPESLLALRVNGVDLSVDHGFPARIIVPAAPGVHCTKWVSSLEFRS